MSSRPSDTARDSRTPDPPHLAPKARLGEQNTSRILASLLHATEAHPTTRKLLLAPDINFGRELLVALARRSGGWIGWEAVNLRGIAELLAFVPLSRAGLRAGSDIEIGALANAALDAAIATGTLDARFAALQSSLGFRHVVRDALLELRMARVRPAQLRAASSKGTPAFELATVLEQYERSLAESKLVDPAGIFATALDAFDAEAPCVLDWQIFVTPRLLAHGLPGELFQRLVAHGAQSLDGDAPLGEAAPSPAAMQQATFFAAATPSDELREVFRRVLADGCRWDDVEMVTCDVDTYGIALDVLCQQLGVGATMLRGIPLARTRLGRALDRWLAWLSDGLAADLLREALEAGEIGAPDGDVPSTALARELRRLQIGWGRARYETALQSLATPREVTRRDCEEDEEYASRVASRNRTSGALQSFLQMLLEATPAVPERGSHKLVRTTTASLVSFALRWLDLAPKHGEAEQQTASRLRERLSQLAEVKEPEVPFSSALAGLRDALADVRAWPMLTRDRKPWSSTGGMVHLTDVMHAGTTGRPRIFVVGLDADRVGGNGRQDPLLTDVVRRALAPGQLLTSTARRAERARQLAVALGSLRGRVTFSYATSGTLDGREAGLAPVFLQCWRIAKGDPSIGYEALRKALLPPTCSVPKEADIPADGRDVWLGAIGTGALLLDGTSLVRQCFTTLRAGRKLSHHARAVRSPRQAVARRPA